MPAATPPAPVITNITGSQFTVTGPTPFDPSWLDGEGNSILVLEPVDIVGGHILTSPTDGTDLTGYLGTVDRNRWQEIAFKWRVLGSSPVVESEPVNAVFIKDLDILPGGLQLRGPQLNQPNSITEWGMEEDNGDLIFTDYTPGSGYGLHGEWIGIEGVTAGHSVRLKVFYDLIGGGTGSSVSYPWKCGQVATYVYSPSQSGGGGSSPGPGSIVTELEDETTIAVDVTTGRHFRVQGMAGNRTIAFSEAQYDGQRLLVQLKATGGARTPSWSATDAAVSFALAPNPGPIAASEERYYTFAYDATVPQWTCLGIA